MILAKEQSSKKKVKKNIWKDASNEKFNDNIVYLLLKKALFMKRIDNITNNQIIGFEMLE